jgi:hypothetical protein
MMHVPAEHIMGMFSGDTGVQTKLERHFAEGFHAMCAGHTWPPVADVPKEKKPRNLSTLSFAILRHASTFGRFPSTRATYTEMGIPGASGPTTASVLRQDGFLYAVSDVVPGTPTIYEITQAGRDQLERAG